MNSNAIYLPKPTGFYAVGSMAVHLIDTSRMNEFASDPAHRELMIQVWYPTEGAVNDVLPTAYAPDAITYWKAQINAIGNATKAQLDSLDQIFVYEKLNASLNQQNAPYPVLIFSPGCAQMRTMNTALCEHVASYGYIVVAIDYTYFSEHVVFPDGRIVEGVKLNLDTVEKEQQFTDMFVTDIAFVVKELKKLNANSDSLLYKSLNPEAIGIFGHSVGGSTALFATHRLQEIKVGLNIDGGIFGDKELLVNFNKPFMHIIAEESVTWAQMLEGIRDDQLMNYGFRSRADLNKILGKATFMKEKLHAQQMSDVYRVVINGAGHMSFGDAIFLKENALLEPLLHLRFGIGTLSGQKVTERTTNYIVAFFDKYLKNKNNDIERAFRATIP
ncbi:MAG: alpha/beta hydrolase family protein [Candidatus Babeliales bacterium]